MISYLETVWPFSLLKPDDLKVSRSLVCKLSIPEQTKEFVLAIPCPETGSVIYLLAVQSLSEQSVLDVDHLIKGIKPDVVVAQIPAVSFPDIVEYENSGVNNVSEAVPTSPIGVISRCFSEKLDIGQFEKLAGSLIIREIFGTGFHGYAFASKRAAEEVNASFLFLVSPNGVSEVNAATNHENLKGATRAHLQSNLLPKNVVSAVSSGSKRYFSLSDPVQSLMLKAVSDALSKPQSWPILSDPDWEPEEFQPRCNFQPPPFGRALYALLTDLHDLFVGIPAIKKALIYTQKILADVQRGECIDAKLLSQVHYFRAAVEGLRVALNSAARCPLDKSKNKNSVDFDLLSAEEKWVALFAHALQSQAQKSKSVVAIVDAGSLYTLRKHWATPIPSQVALLAHQGFIPPSDDDPYELVGTLADRKRLLSDRPVVAVGAGATAIVGISSFSKAMPASTLMKLVYYKLPAVLKFSFAYMQRSAAIGLSKILGPSKVFAPGIASKVFGFKATASAENIRRVTHGAIAYVERNSLYAMRTAFYEIMRRRHVRPIQLAPMATFCCSVATCAGFLAYGDNIECAAESVPLAPLIASWGRGLQSLHHASNEIGQGNRRKLQEVLQTLLHSMRKEKSQ